MILLVETLQKLLLPIANKMNKNRYIKAARDGFMLALPYRMVGSILTSLISIPFLAGIMSEGMLSAIKNFVSPTSVFSNNIMALFAVIGIAYSLAKSYGLNAIHGAMVSMVVFLMGIPVSVTTKSGEVVLNVMPMDAFGARAIFTAMIIAITAVEIYRFAIAKKFTIKLPDSVPASIQDSFTAFIPAGMAMMYGAVIRAGFSATHFGTITNFIFEMFQKPLMALGTSVPATLFAGMLCNLFWFFGLHGQSMVGSVFGPLWAANSAENIAALELGQALPHVVTSTFVKCFITYGSWISIPLLIALYLYRGKRKDWGEVGKIGLIPGLFNIYEPLMFGLPLVLNPFMFIPMMLTPLISGTMGYLATLIGLIPHTTGIELPITVPIGLAGMLGTNSIMGGVLQILLVIPLAAMWYLFLRIQDISERNQGLYSEEEKV